MDDGPATPALVLWTAKRVITQHAAGRCLQCQDGECRMLTWARDALKAHRATGIRPHRW